MQFNKFKQLAVRSTIHETSLSYQPTLTCHNVGPKQGLTVVTFEHVSTSQQTSYRLPYVTRIASATNYRALYTKKHHSAANTSAHLVQWENAGYYSRRPEFDSSGGSNFFFLPCQATSILDACSVLQKRNAAMRQNKLIFLHKYKPSQTALCTAYTFFYIQQRTSLGDVNQKNLMIQ